MSSFYVGKVPAAGTLSYSAIEEHLIKTIYF